MMVKKKEEANVQGRDEENIIEKMICQHKAVKKEEEDDRNREENRK